MNVLLVQHGKPVKERIERARKALPWHINLAPSVIYDHDRDRERDRYLCREISYEYKLFEFPEGTSKKMMVYRIRRAGFIPADPAHMLAFAEQGFKDMPYNGEWTSYVIGWGGELQTVLGSQFQGMNTGTVFFFQHVPQDRPMHEGGNICRFLGIREIPAP